MLSLLHIVAVLAAQQATAALPASAWFGTWKLRLTAPGEKPETLVYSDAGGGAMRMVSVEDGSVIVTRFDGMPAADTGQTSGDVRTLAVKATSPTSYAWTFAVAGKPVVTGVNTLSADGRTFQEVAQPLSKPGTRLTFVYERQ